MLMFIGGWSEMGSVFAVGGRPRVRRNATGPAPAVPALALHHLRDNLKRAKEGRAAGGFPTLPG